MALLVLLYSCGPQPLKDVNKDVQSAMEITGFDNLLEKNYLFIVPRTGCMGCISSAESFMLETFDSHQSQLNILLTDINSYKTAKVRFGEAFMSAENVFIDKQGQFTHGSLNTLYPMILSLEQGKVVAMELVSPENGLALENFRQSLE